MAVRVVARIRPTQYKELDKDIIVSTVGNGHAASYPTEVKIPNPRNEKENFTFNFSSVYDHLKSQQDLFENEVAPTIKHLFSGFDVTIFAYGSTGAGKTHTMRGGKSLAERGMIPRLLSGIFRRARKVTKESVKETSVEISLSYMEIYNDRCFDLFEPPEKRSLAGLPLRDNGNKAVVVGLTERPCESLKEFENLYDQANLNRSTSATKLNAVSSRSHAILGIKLTITTGDQNGVSTASAIDLAGSEDNRRTENRKERLIESASINKSLFTLAKCVEAIGRQETRIPYRESKMTRILNIGQNNSLTVMILNLAPERRYNQDTLSSLNFAKRTKKIEVREIENEPAFKGCTRAVPTIIGTSLQRQPLRPLGSFIHNSAIHALSPPNKRGNRQVKAFPVYTDRARLSNAAHVETLRHSPLKRPSDPFSSNSRPTKRRSPDCLLLKAQPAISQKAIEKIIEDKVTDILTARAMGQPAMDPLPNISMEVRKRLEVLEKKINSNDGGREQGLAFLVIAKQHAVQGDDISALRMYTLAKDYFPDNQKLDLKLENLRKKVHQRKSEQQNKSVGPDAQNVRPLVYGNFSRPQANNRGVQGGQVNARLMVESSKLGTITKNSKVTRSDSDYEIEIYGTDNGHESDGSFHYKAKTKKNDARSKNRSEDVHTPRTKCLLDIVNTRDISQIRLLRGVGAKKAETIVAALRGADGDESNAFAVQSLAEVGRLRGVGPKTVESMRVGLQLG